MRYRVDEWVDDESRNSGKNIFTVSEILPDGTEEEVLETRDRDEVKFCGRSRVRMVGGLRIGINSVWPSATWAFATPRAAI
jgi:hypothetical protein